MTEEIVLRPSSGTAVYPHMPILRVARAHARIMAAHRAYVRWAAITRATRAIRPILGFWGSNVPQNGRFPALDADEPPCKIWHR